MQNKAANECFNTPKLGDMEKQGFQSTLQPIDNGEMEERRPSCLWSSEASCMAGNLQDKDYRLRTSNAEDSGHFGQIMCQQRDHTLRVTQCDNESVSSILREARRIPVLFYATYDQRGWLIDGASAMVYLIKAYVHDLDFDDLLDTDVKTKLDQLPVPLQGGPKAACSLRANLNFAIWGPEITIGYLVKRYFAYLMAMCHAACLLKRGPTQVQPTRLYGWEANEIMCRDRFVNPIEVKLGTGAKEWIPLVQDLESAVLISRTFGELLQSEKPMPESLSLLAIPLYLLESVSRLFWYGEDLEHGETGSVQLTRMYHWHTSAHPCQCGENDKHSCNLTSPIKEHSADSSAVGLIRKYPNGAIILGREEDAREKKSAGTWSKLTRSFCCI